MFGESKKLTVTMNNFTSSDATIDMDHIYETSTFAGSSFSGGQVTTTKNGAAVNVIGNDTVQSLGTFMVQMAKIWQAKSSHRKTAAPASSPDFLPRNNKKTRILDVVRFFYKCLRSLLGFAFFFILIGALIPCPRIVKRIACSGISKSARNLLTKYRD